MPLTTEQKDVVRKIIKGIDDDPVQTLGGYAGTGKSTVLRVIIDALANRGQSFAACAYTGKAANVLRKKGVQADTIHGTIYRAYQDENGETVWALADKYSLAQKGVDGFVVDEASMVSGEVHNDLRSFGLPIIYVGDHGQLEPIGSNLNLMKDPMYKLETVHRNAGEIAHFAEWLRQGKPSWKFKGMQKVQVVDSSKIEDKHLASVDQVICGFNKFRVELNERVRHYKGINISYIAKGEKIICLRNNRKLGLFNGMQGIVTKIHDKNRISFTSDGTLFDKIPYDPDQFGKEKNEFTYSQTANPFDYAHAITAHKSQGDEFGNVIAYEQESSYWCQERYNYTIASRAKNGLIWARKKVYLPSYL